ncbi:MAG: T9SS type A sorting domain-containing protein [Flavobacteriales bacterium]|nr:T9SS type A sorting domain-containing protein [Flavobacteriales bacterium]
MKKYLLTSLFNVLLLYVFLVNSSLVVAQSVTLLPGEGPTIQNAEVMVGNGRSIYSHANCFLNKGKGMLSIGIPLFSALNAYDNGENRIAIYYNGNWYRVCEIWTDNFNYGSSPFASPPAYSTWDVANYAVGSAYPAHFGNDSTTKVVEGWVRSGANPAIQRSVYMFNNGVLKRYNGNYLPDTSSLDVQHRLDTTDYPNFSLQTEVYSASYDYPVSDPSPSSGVQAVTGAYSQTPLSAVRRGNLPGVGTLDLTDATFGNSTFFYINIVNLPPEMLESGNFRVHVYQSSFSTSTNTIFEWVYNNQNFMENAPISFTASDDKCGLVRLNWGNASNSLPTDGTVSLKTVILRDGVYLDMVDGSSTTYDDSTAVLDVEYDYSLKHVAFSESGKTYWSSPVTSSVTGYAEKSPDQPINPEASNDDCTGEINVSWDYSGANPKYFRIKRSISSSGPFTLLKDSIAGSARDYTDMGVVRGTTYYYQITTRNSCNDTSMTYAECNGISPIDPAAPSNLSTSVDAVNETITLTWTDNANNETSYEVIRQDDAGNTVYFDVNPQSGSGSTMSYVDEGVAPCTAYTYKVKAYNACVLSGVLNSGSASTNQLPPPNLASTFSTSNYMSASKGYYVNRVEIQWNNENNSVLDYIKVYRKQLGTSSSPVQIASVTPGNELYIDYTSDAGVYYEYSLVGEVYCLGTTYNTDTITNVGFRSANGVVNGHIEYGGGVAVQGAKVNVESQNGTTGRSLTVSSGNYGVIPHGTDFDFTNEFTLQAYVKIPATSIDVSILKKTGSFELKYTSADALAFEVTTGSTQTLSASATIDDNSFHQVTAVYDSAYLRIYLDGAIMDSIAHTGNVTSNLNDLWLGNLTSGSMSLDEVRIYAEALTSEEVSQSFSRVLLGNESGLVGYYRLNEADGGEFYDVSYHNGTIYNENHGYFVGAPTYTSNIPTAIQLSFAGYTNVNGDYTVNVGYQGVGEIFTVTPQYLTHQFSPGTRSLYIGDNSQVQNGIDFTDISSFEVSGNLAYYGTTCPVKDATLLIDGTVVILNGSTVKTDANGNFTIDVPIGNHFITIEKSGHEMNAGRYPPTGTYDFQADMAGIQFTDSTFVKVVGRVAGGLREANKLPNLGRGSNNIGQATLTFTSQAGGGCVSETVQTVDSTGEYEIYLPPMKYVPTVTVNSNLALSFGTLSLIDLSIVPSITNVYDTIGYDTLNNVYYIDSTWYQHLNDYIYRVNPEINVLDYENPDTVFFGMHEYTYEYPNGTTETIDLTSASSPVPWALFDARGEGAEASAIIRVYELYANHDGGNTVYDSVPTTDGELRFNNELSSLGVHGLNMSDVNSLDSLRDLVYTFPLGTPNFTENSSIPQFSYTKKLQITLLLSNGTAIDWLPNNYKGASFSANDNVFRGYILGTKSDGQQFITAGPEIPEYILRDPPGSNSFASREIGATKTTENSWSWSEGGTTSSTDNIFLGTKFLAGLGVAIETDIESNTSFGFESSSTGGESGTESVTVTNTQEWQTNSNAYLPGRSSDLYIGKSKNVTFGISETLNLVPDDISGDVEALSSLIDASQLTLAKTYGLSVIPGGYSTQFMYSEEDIKSVIIPDLIEMRNVMLQSNAKYTSHLSVLDPNYGLNNDHPQFDPVAQNITSDQKIAYMLNLADSTDSFFIFDENGNLLYNEEFQIPTLAQQAIWNKLDSLKKTSFTSLSGASYTYNAVDFEDSLTGDSIRWINNQITQWENAIMLNEWEKVNISNTVIKNRLKNAELTKLYNKYSSIIYEYSELSSVSGSFQDVASLSLVPVPGYGLGGIGSFDVGSAAGVSAAKIYNEFSSYQLQKQTIIDKFSQTQNNYSISGGNTFTSSITHESASTYTTSIEYGMSESLGLEVSAKVNNTGVSFSSSLSLDFSTGRDWSETSSSTETVAFTLYDQDQNDLFSVDVFPSLLGWGPVFKLKPGGRTSCPHEDALLTEYYLDNPANSSSNVNHPYFVLSERTQQIEKVEMSASPTLVTNVPVGSAASFNLTLSNLSETNDDVTYRLQLDAASNPFGAYVKIDGVAPSVDVLINGGSSINKVITVEKGPGSTYDYDSLLVLIHSNCQYDPTSATDDYPDIVDSAYISAHFLPTCTDVAFITPEDQWVLNNSFNDTMPVIFDGYDINFYDFESVRLDYKPSSSSAWVGLQTFYKDTSGMNDPTLEVIPTSSSYTGWEWITDQLTDGNYDVRLVSQCALAENVSLTHSGVMDRINPHPFGTPSPADGILDPNDDIYIQMNEPIDIGSLNSYNFDVRGVLNGSDIRHSESLNFDGTADYVRVAGGANLKQRSFTVEFWAKVNASGVIQTIFSQGTNTTQSMAIGIDASDHFFMRIGTSTVTSDAAVGTPSEWHHYAAGYDYTNNQGALYVDGVLVNSGNLNLYFDYQGEGKLAFGKELPNNTNFFNGNIHEMRLWNDLRSVSEITVNMAIELTGNESGLLYNWRMNEAEGNLAEDHVRARNGDLYGPTWEVNPNGYAANFDGIDDYVTVNSSTIPITKEMDFTLEFWFRSSQTGVATLFSNGTGDGVQADSLISWNIAKDASGIIHVYHNGLDFVATNQDYFDGDWHHFALVLNRNANLSSYIDGNLENSVQSTSFEQMGSVEMYLGAHGYTVSTIFTVDDFFQGDIDEFRFWNASRKLEQIQRDLRNSMLGDEYALQAYVPFENYQLVLGVPNITSTFNDQSDNGLTVVENGSTTLISQTPTLRLPRPVQDVAFTYSVNNDKIIITPTTSSELIEKVTLDITVKDVQDLNGNTMQSPKTWIAYVNKNQVLWQDDEFNFTKTEDSVITFSTYIVNTGGDAKAYTIAGLPSWLSSSITSGTISPNSTQLVTFTIDDGYAVGEYFADVTLTTDFGYDEVLRVNLSVVGDPPHWTVDPSDFAYNMIVFGELEIDGIINTNTGSMLGAFIGDSLCGVANLQYLSAYDRYEVFLNVYSNSIYGDSIEFQIYDASSGYTFVEVTPSLMFVENDVQGTVANPITFEASTTIALNIPLNKGWTWVSLPLETTGLNSSNTLADGIINTTGDVIKGQFNFDQYDQTVGWLGSISSGSGYLNAESYKFNKAVKDTLTLVGKRIHPDSTIALISLDQGWNWMGYVSTKVSDLATALGQLTPTDGDIIKSQYNFAVYDNLNGWIGSLTQMKAGYGYMYKAANATTFTYPLSLYYGKSEGDFIEDKVKIPNEYACEVGDFSKTMSIIGEANLCKEVLADENVILVVFDANNEVRGHGFSKKVGEEYKYFITAYSNTDNEELFFEYVNLMTRKTADVSRSLLFQGDLLKGTLEESEQLFVDESDVCVLTTPSTVEDLAEIGFSYYPNPFNQEIVLEFEELSAVTVTLKDVLGRTILTESFSVQGTHRLSVAEQLPPGLYTLSVSGDIEANVKLIKN